MIERVGIETRNTETLKKGCNEFSYWHIERTQGIHLRVCRDRDKMLNESCFTKQKTRNLEQSQFCPDMYHPTRRQGNLLRSFVHDVPKLTRRAHGKTDGVEWESKRSGSFHMMPIVPSAILWIWEREDTHEDAMGFCAGPWRDKHGRHTIEGFCRFLIHLLYSVLWITVSGTEFSRVRPHLGEILPLESTSPPPGFTRSEHRGFRIC